MIALGRTSQGSALVQGVDSIWGIAAELLIGGPGPGTLTVNSGRVESQDAHIGFQGTNSGVVKLDNGARWTTFGNLTLGPAGASMAIDHGSQVQVNGTTLLQGSSNITVQDDVHAFPSASLTVFGDLVIKDSANVLNQTHGGGVAANTINVQGSGTYLGVPPLNSFDLGAGASANTINLQDAAIFSGAAYTNQMNIQDKALLNVTSGEIVIAHTLKMTGGVIQNNGQVYVDNNLLLNGPAKVLVHPGGTLSLLSQAVDPRIESTVSIDGSALLYISGGNLKAGNGLQDIPGIFTVLNGSLVVANGGTAELYGVPIFIGGTMSNAPMNAPMIQVIGQGSRLLINQLLAIGTNGTGSLRVEDGGVVSTTRPAAIGARNGSESGFGTVLVTGGSQWVINDALSIGAFLLPGNSDRSTLSILDGGSVTATSGTTLGPAGILVLSGGHLFGNLVNNGGVITPIHPGVQMLLNGSYTQLAGEVDLEIAGLTPDKFDRFVIHGTGDFEGGFIHLSFLDGFVPHMGDKFDLLLADQGLTFTKNMFEFSGIEPGFLFDTQFVDGDLILTALNDAAPVPEPSAFLLFGSGLAGLSLVAALRRGRGAFKHALRFRYAPARRTSN